jgi:hypothetical protein
MGSPDIPGMMQVGWRNRETGEVVDKHLTCNDATFIPCKSAGDARVFCLKFENNRRCFFWMQELDGSSDEQNALRLNDIIAGKENEPTAGAAVDLENLGIGEEEMMAINALPPNERDELLMQLGLAAPSGMMGDFGGPVMTPAAQPAPIHPPPVLRANQDPEPPSDSPMLEVPTPDLGGDDDDEDDAEEGDDAMDAE